MSKNNEQRSSIKKNRKTKWRYKQAAVQEAMRVWAHHGKLSCQKLFHVQKNTTITCAQETIHNTKWNAIKC